MVRMNWRDGEESGEGYVRYVRVSKCKDCMSTHEHSVLEK